MKYLKIILTCLVLLLIIYVVATQAISRRGGSSDTPHATVDKESPAVSVTMETGQDEAEKVYPEGDTIDEGSSVPPVEVPELAPDEIEMTSIAFSKNEETGEPAVRVSFSSSFAYELKEKSADRYVLEVTRARIVSQIFAQPQSAPSGFEPFTKVVPSELKVPGQPVKLLLDIKLSSPAKLDVRKDGSTLEVYKVSGAA